MSTLRSKGMGKDKQGYPAEMLEDSVTGAQYLAYSPEVYDQRVRDAEELRRLESRERRDYHPELQTGT